MADHPAKALKDELINVLSKETDEIAIAKKAEIKGLLERYYSELLVDIKDPNHWKKKILEDERVRIEDGLDNKDSLSEVAVEDKVLEYISIIESSYRWIVPIPPDPVVVAYVIARDRAAADAEKPPKGVIV